MKILLLLPITVLLIAVIGLSAIKIFFYFVRVINKEPNGELNLHEPSHYPPEPKPPWVDQAVYDQYIRNYNNRNGYPEDKKWYIGGK